MNNTNITLSFQEKIEKANKDFSLFDGADKILVGLSGGADSTSLVLVLKKLSQKYGFSLFALHVNHMIRGEEADRDEDFARNLCEKYGIEFFCERVDVPALSKERSQSLELCARNERYKAFERVCKKHAITHVATAHNACDNAETVVFNLVRGTGTRGLCGIPPKRRLCEGVTVIRPLIYAERCEIEEYLSYIGQTFVVDSTNDSTDYTRNYIRSEIMPRLKKINPSAEESLLRTARLHTRDEDYLSKIADENLSDSISELKVLHESILSRVVIKLFSRYSEETLPEMHVKELCDKIYSYDGKKMSLSLPGQLCAKLFRGRLSFEKDERGGHPQKDFEVTAGGGCIFFEENPYALYISFDQNEDIPQILVNGEIVYKKYNTDYLYFDTIPRVFCIRNRRDGDKIKSCNMNKSIKRLMVSSDYNEGERYLVPFVCMDEEILLVPKLSVSDNCKKGEGRTQCVCVTLYRTT